MTRDVFADLPALLDALTRPDAYPVPTVTVEVRQTHISIVLLAGEFVYKLKKPVNFGFLDFSTREKRRHFCEEEVRLNRRLAPDVYLGVVPLTEETGRLRFEGPGEPLERAVKMRRLPADATLERRLERDAVTPGQFAALARRLADFHAQAATDERIAAFGRFDVVARNARENFEQTRAYVGQTVSPAVFERVRELTESHLARHRDLIERRAKAGVPRDTHGDLRVDHVYFFPDRPPPDDLVIIDCIEFNERFRFADPVADLAFLRMDLAFHGRRDLARVFADAYFTASGDAEGRALLPLYAAYRAVVRAKVEGIKHLEAEVPAAERDAALLSARAHWLLALDELDEPKRRPALLLVGGLPGTGKSTLARHLAARANFEVLRSDVVRKELAGLSPEQPATIGYGQGLYADDWTERTYAEVLRQAKSLLWEGRRVLIDASFRAEQYRRLFLDAARAWGVRGLFLHCHADPMTVRQRLQARKGDASDADCSIYERAAAAWEEPGESSARVTHVLRTDGDAEEVAARAEAVLRDEGLAE